MNLIHTFIYIYIYIQAGAQPNDTFQIWILRRRDSLSRGGGKGNGRGEDAISYGQLQWSVGTCNNVLPVFEVSATSLGPLGHPTSLYQISSCGGSWKTVCSGGRIVTIQELKQTTVDEFAAIDEDLRRCVYGNVQTRLQQCIDVNGGDLSYVQKISL